MMVIWLTVMDAVALVQLKLVSFAQEDPQPEEILAVKKHQLKLFFHQVDNHIFGDKS